jgi:hypothetical protein
MIIFSGGGYLLLPTNYLLDDLGNVLTDDLGNFLLAL